MNVETAQEALTAATAAAAMARAEVTEAREAVALGEATAKEVTRATKALERAMEREEQARATLAVYGRRAQVEKDEMRVAVERARRELTEATRQKAEVESSKYRIFLEETRTTVARFDERLAAYERTLGRGAINVPSRFSSFGLMNQAIGDQLVHFSRPSFKED